jgi:hypothetical protein
MSGGVLTAYFWIVIFVISDTIKIKYATLISYSSSQTHLLHPCQSQLHLLELFNILSTKSLYLVVTELRLFHLASLVSLINAFKKQNIDCVLTQHESSAAFAVSSRSRVGGGIGVCFSKSGPGTGQTMSLLIEAKSDSVPMLLISATIPQAKLNTQSFQDVGNCAVVLLR